MNPETVVRLRLAALARQLAPAVASRILAAIAQLRDAVQLARLGDLLAARDTSGALALLFGPNATPALNSLGDATRDAMRQARVGANAGATARADLLE